MLLQWKNFTIDLVSFNDFIKNNIPKSDGIIADSSGFTIIEKIPFDQTDIDVIQTYYDSLTEEGEIAKITPRLTNELINKKIREATDFGINLIRQYVIENIQMGITQAGKTRIVADYLRRLQRYIESGSLYAALEELNALINAPIDSELAPYVTVDRLTTYKQKIQAFLEI